MQNKKIFTLTLTGLLIAISIILKLFTPYIPIAGFFVLRVDFHGAFSNLIGVLFGPLIGGIGGALIDFLGYIFANKTPNGYIPLLTVTSFLNCALFALIWNKIKNVKKHIIQKSYIICTSLILLFGVFNYLYSKYFFDTAYSLYLEKIGDTRKYFINWAIVIGIIGIILWIINQIINLINKESFIYNNYFKLFLALIIPGIIFTTINTKILIMFIPSLSGKNFLLFLVPRIVTEIFETFLEAYIISLLLYIIIPMLKQKNISI